MGQSVSRVNDRSSVPGPLGHGMGERPVIGVGREGGHEEAATPDSAGVPHAPIRRKQTLGEQHQPVKPVESTQTDEQKGFRGRLHRGWLTTIGVFQRKHEQPNKTIAADDGSRKKDKVEQAESPSMKSSPSTPSSSSSSSVIPPMTPPSRARAMSSPAMTAATAASPTLRARSSSMAHEQPSSLNDEVAALQDKAKTMTPNEMAAARAAAIKAHQDITTSPRGGIHQVGAPSSMSVWWRNHHPSLDQMMPPTYATGNSQPDELHRESRDPTYQSSSPMAHEPNSPSISKGGMMGSFDEAIPPTTMKPHVSRNVGGGVNMNPRKRSASPNRQPPHEQEHGNLNDHRQSKAAAIAGGNRGYQYQGDKETGFGTGPPMLSPWNTQPDELHREPTMTWRKYPSSSSGDGNGNGAPTTSGSGGGGAIGGGGSGSGGVHHEAHHHYWPPGRQSLHNNDNHTMSGGWPMNP